MKLKLAIIVILITFGLCVEAKDYPSSTNSSELYDKTNKGKRSITFSHNVEYSSNDGVLSVRLGYGGIASISVENSEGEEIVHFMFSADGFWHTFYVGHLPQDIYLLAIETSFGTYFYEIAIV